MGLAISVWSVAAGIHDFICGWFVKNLIFTRAAVRFIVPCVQHEVAQLHREITGLGFRGSYGTVYAHLAPLRKMPAPAAVPAPPKIRHITSWIRRRPDNLDTDEQLQLTDVLAACSHLDALHHHVKAFAEMMTGLGSQATRRSSRQATLLSIIRTLAKQVNSGEPIGEPMETDPARHRPTVSHRNCS